MFTSVLHLTGREQTRNAQFAFCTMLRVGNIKPGAQGIWLFHRFLYSLFHCSNGKIDIDINAMIFIFCRQGTFLAVHLRGRRVTFSTIDQSDGDKLRNSTHHINVCDISVAAWHRIDSLLAIPSIFTNACDWGDKKCESCLPLTTIKLSLCIGKTRIPL